MKKVLFLLCFIVLMTCCGCGILDLGQDDNIKTYDIPEGEKISPEWRWSEPAEVYFDENDQGALVVRNTAGEEIIDLSSYDGAVILRDENSDLCRCIKTYNKSEDSEGLLYSYYDTNGTLLEDNTADNIISIIEDIALCESPEYPFFLRCLSKGTILTGGGEDMSCYLSEKGFVTVSKGGGSVFWSFAGEKIKSLDAMVIPLVPGKSCTYDPIAYSWRDSIKSKPANSGDLTAREGETVNKGESYSDLISSLGRDEKGSLCEFSCFMAKETEEDDSAVALLDGEGNTLIDYEEIKGYSLKSDGQILSHGSKTTEILGGSSLEEIETLDFGTTYFDGKNAIKQNEKYYNYLTDNDGGNLSQCYWELEPVDSVLGEELYFAGQEWNSWYVDVMDKDGNVLFTDKFEADLYYLGDGVFYCVSPQAGKYVVDSEGKVIEAIALKDNYFLNKAGEMEEK